MNFYPWVTDYDLYRQEFREQALPYRDFMLKRYDELSQAKLMPYRLIMEATWLKDGKPYYHVHPNLVSQLVRIKLDKIPSHLLVVPEPFGAVHISFAKDHPELMIEGVDPLPVGTVVRGILMGDAQKISAAAKISSPPTKIFCMDFSHYDRITQPIYAVFTIGLHLNESLQEVFERSIDKSRSPSYKRMCENALRLAATIGFMANSKSELIEPDVLAKLRTEYAQANERRKGEIVAKSRRRGKIGFNVGNDLMFLGPQPVKSVLNATGTGKELQYQHIRGGHPHAVRYGPGKNLVKIMWYQPTQVRPDLPFKPE